MFKFKRKRKINTQEMESMRIISNETDFDIVEPYKQIRTNIMFSLPKKENGKVICVTSSVPGEGKTTTCINIAITFAQTGARVVLVDCDLRKPRIHRYLKKQRGAGVSNILCGFSEIDETILKNARDNLDILTAGEVPLNPAELLQTPEFENLISELRKKYDYIFIDTPPVTVVTDAVIVSKVCDGIVIVVRANYTTFDMLEETTNALEKTGKQILGAVVIGAETKTERYGHYKKGKYGYKYSDKVDNELKQGTR